MIARQYVRLSSRPTMVPVINGRNNRTGRILILSRGIRRSTRAALRVVGEPPRDAAHLLGPVRLQTSSKSTILSASRRKCMGLLLIAIIVMLAVFFVL